MRKGILFASFITFISAVAQTEATDTISTRQLDEVVVKGEKPQVKGKDGIIVVDIPGIVKDKPVNNILEALGYMAHGSFKCHDYSQWRAYQYAAPESLSTSLHHSG